VRWPTGAASLIVAGAGCLPAIEATAGELSFAPTINFGADDDSDRYLVPGGLASQSETVQFSAELKGSTAATDFTISPDLRYQRFEPGAFSDVFERNIGIVDAWNLERGKVTLTGQAGDYSTLTTEPTESGILNSRLHQRINEGGLSYAYDQTERLTLALTGSYLDISYYGAPDSALLNLLSGYRYPSGSITEQYRLTETATLSANVTYSEVQSKLQNFNSRTAGGDLEYRNSFSDTLSFAAAIGESEDRSVTIEHINTGSLSLTKSFESGSVVVSYVRSLTPLGTSALVQRQVFSLSGTKSLSDQLDATLTLSRVQNAQVNAEPQFAPQVQTYNSGALIFSWRFAEFWHLNAELDSTRTQAIYETRYTVQEWRAGLTLAWTPRALTTGF
jgi:hypothetical protein